MVVGYSLGNRNDQEEDIQVLGEDSPNVITYSQALAIGLTRTCRNKCPYCNFQKSDQLVVPYSTIKLAKKVRQTGTREALYVAGERPDHSPQLRAQLDLWGFHSYLDYAYTICELGFLEGLIPTIEIGFLTPAEMKRLQEVCALTKIMLDCVEKSKFEKIYPKSPGKKLEARLKSLEWAGKLGFPTVTGIMVGIGETKDFRKTLIRHIADIHKKYGTIHEVLIQNFVPAPGTPFADKSAPSKADILQTVEMAVSELPDDVPVIVPYTTIDNLRDYIKAGVRDLGRIWSGKLLLNGEKRFEIDDINQKVEKLGFKLQQRFPLRKAFIQQERYSKKLGQVFDTYKYKIKKETMEKKQEAKLNAERN